MRVVAAEAVDRVVAAPARDLVGLLRAVDRVGLVGALDLLGEREGAQAEHEYAGDVAMRERNASSDFSSPFMFGCGSHKNVIRTGLQLLDPGHRHRLSRRRRVRYGTGRPATRRCA